MLVAAGRHLAETEREPADACPTVVADAGAENVNEPCRLMPPMRHAMGSHCGTPTESSMIAEMSRLRTRKCEMSWHTARAFVVVAAERMDDGKALLETVDGPR